MFCETFTHWKKEKAVPEHTNSQVQTQGMMVSDYTGAKTLLECFFRVDRRENTCKDKVGVGGGLSLAAWVTLPDT